jgi:hypothetical protein
MKIKSLITLVLLITAVLILQGCAKKNWVHPTADNYQFQRDAARCDMYAKTGIQVPSTSSESKKSYDTNCYGNENYVNCKTIETETDTYKSSGETLGALIGTMFARKNRRKQCMISLGYSLERIAN